MRIVQTYYTSGHGTGDPPNLVTEDGTHWRYKSRDEIDDKLTFTGASARADGGYVW